MARCKQPREVQESTNLYILRQCVGHRRLRGVKVLRISVYFHARAKITGTYRDAALRTDTHPLTSLSHPHSIISVSLYQDDSHLCWCESYNLHKEHSALTPFIRPFSSRSFWALNNFKRCSYRVTKTVVFMRSFSRVSFLVLNKMGASAIGLPPFTAHIRLFSSVNSLV